MQFECNLVLLCMTVVCVCHAVLLSCGVGEAVTTGAGLFNDGAHVCWETATIALSGKRKGGPSLFTCPRFCRRSGWLLESTSQAKCPDIEFNIRRLLLHRHEAGSPPTLTGVAPMSSRGEAPSGGAPLRIGLRASGWLGGGQAREREEKDGW